MIGENCHLILDSYRLMSLPQMLADHQSTIDATVVVDQSTIDANVVVDQSNINAIVVVEISFVCNRR